MTITLSTLENKAKKNKKRLGRGSGTGRGTYSGRGIKGQRSRSGGKSKSGHAGKKYPAFIRQIPKQRGFVSLKTGPQVVNLADIGRAFKDGEAVDPKSLLAKKLISVPNKDVKVLGRGGLAKKLTIHVHAFSKGAKNAITKAGGSAEIIERAKKKGKSKEE